MAPRRASRMCGSTYLAPSHADLRSTPMNRSQSSLVIVVASKLALTPALLTRIVAGPNALAHVSATAAMSDSLLTSAGTELGFPPSCCSVGWAGAGAGSTEDTQ